MIITLFKKPLTSIDYLYCSMKVLAAAACDNDFPAEIVYVISNRSDAKDLGLTKDQGSYTGVFNDMTFLNRNAFDTELHNVLCSLLWLPSCV